MPDVRRYSNEELELFKIHIEQKLEKAVEDLRFLRSQIEDTNEAADNDGDWKEDTTNNDLELLYTMANRHQKHIRDLENALVRIRQKTYGICVVTGKLIDKKRLMAVPTTTKSVAAKNEAALQTIKGTSPPSPKPKNGKPVKITSKIIRKKKTPADIAPVVESEDDDEGIFVDDDPFTNLEFDDPGLSED